MSNSSRMRQREGMQLKGRFIKASDKRVLETVALSDFNFREIGDNSVTQLDNTRQNLLHPPLHTEEEMASAVKLPAEISKDLRSEDARRPILRPIDFTADWRRQKERAQAKRRHGLDEEDDLEAVLESRSRRKTRKGEPATKQSSDAAASEPGKGVDKPTSFRMVDRPMQTMQHAGDEPIEASEPVDQSVAPENPSIQAIGDEINRLSSPDNLGSDARGSAGAGDFIPTNVSQHQEFRAGEQAAVNSYKRSLDQQEQFEKELAKAKEEATAQGYQEGFQVGEEKASYAAMQGNAVVLENINEIASELETLKKTILSNTQENFYELVQAIAETLIRRELRVNPQAFADLIRTAISEHMENDEIKIKVNSETLTKLKETNDEKITAKLFADDSVPAGDFRLESNLSVVNGNLKDLIKETLSNADIGLFDEQEIDQAG